MKWEESLLIIDGMSKELFCRKRKFLLKYRRNLDLKAFQELEKAIVPLRIHFFAASTVFRGCAE